MKTLTAAFFCLLLAACEPQEQPVPCDRGLIAHLEDEVAEEEAEVRRLTLALRNAALNSRARLQRALVAQQREVDELKQTLADEQARCN